MNKVLFWDFDGTLIYSDSKWSKSLQKAFSMYGHEISIEEIRKHMGMRLGYSWDTPEVSYTKSIGYTWWKTLFLHYDKLYEQQKIDKAIGDKISELLREEILDPSLYTLYEDTIEVLKQCKELGFENYILSNNFPELYSIIEQLGLTVYFKDYIVSANVGYEKPRKELFEYALKLAGNPENCYMIGDNPVADIQGGKAVGMKTILVHREGVYDVDYHCKELSEIPEILKFRDK